MRLRLSIVAVATLLVVLAAAGVAGAAAKSSAPPSNTSFKVIVVLKSGGKGASVMARLKAGDATKITRYHIIPAIAATVSRETLQALKKDASVLRVVSDSKVAAPRDPAGVEGLKAKGSSSKATAGEGYLESEAVQLTHADDAWGISVNGQKVMGQGVRVGMLDTGTDPTHPDLKGAIEDYRDFTGQDLYDWDGHGTGTSSCVVAQGLPVYNDYTGTTMSYSGMAPKAKVLMAKVITVGGGWDSNIIRGIQWLVDEKVDLISCSLGSLSLPQNGVDPTAMAAQAAIDAGITFVNSEGNDGPGAGTVGSVPDRTSILAVGASTGYREFAQEDFLTSGDLYKGDQVITWSSRGPNSAGDFRPDILGFGAYGWALAPNNGDVYKDFGMQEFGGTSMAAPVVAGDLALAESAWKLKNPGKALPSPAYWKKLLASTATDLGYPAYDQSSGLVNAAAAVKAVLKRGKSMMVGVTADSAAPSSWSPKIAGGAKASTKVSIKNTGNKKEKVKLSSATFVADPTLTITKSITLNGPNYTDDEAVTIPAGTDFVQVSVTWPSGPNVSIRSSVYDSDGNFITYAPTYGGYGHLSCDQVSLIGPKDQRPVVKDGAPWTVSIYPRASMMPTAPQQVNLKIEFMHKQTWSAIKLAKTKVTVKKNRTKSVKVTVKAPTAAGTYTGAITASNGQTVATIPVSVRVPVTMTSGTGTFSGSIVGSTAEYYGGEFYFYDFDVPQQTSMISAQLQWPDQGNLVNIMLVDPNGRVQDAKGGDLWFGDYTDGTVPDAALTRTSEQVVWYAPMAGRWQILVWAPGFSGNGFSEPFTGSITLDRTVVLPGEWTASAAPGATVGADFTVTNAGPTDLPAYAESQLVYEGVPRYYQGGFQNEDLLYPGDHFSGDPGWLYGMTGLYVPQGSQMVELDTVWNWSKAYDPENPTMIDLGLYDPVGADVSQSMAASSLGNSVVALDPMSGWWTGVLSYANPTLPAPILPFMYAFYWTAPLPMPGMDPGSAFDAPVNVTAGGTGTIHAAFTVPADAVAGDTITGTLDFYTSGGYAADTIAGGDHLRSVPVTINVVAP